MHVSKTVYVLLDNFFTTLLYTIIDQFCIFYDTLSIIIIVQTSLHDVIHDHAYNYKYYNMQEVYFLLLKLE